nr:zinc finger protein 358-like [Monopterus albus]
MSIEYTIDIQLTELGFPDILQPQESSVRETPSHRGSTSDESFSSSLSATSLSATRKQSLLVKGQQSADGEEAGAAKQTSNIPHPTLDSVLPLSDKLPCKPINPAQSMQDEQTVREPALGELSEAPLHDPTSSQETTDSPLLITEERQKDVSDKAQLDSAEMVQDEEDDSDDSEVSGVYEEEEFDEEEDYEEEEEQNNELSPSGDYHCIICDLKLSSKLKLLDHMNMHTGARPYGCAECGKRFCQIYNYRVHLRTHAQAKVDRLLCRICRKGFTSQEDLKDHLSKTHFEDEFYECDLCKRVFTSLKVCEYHVKLHKCMLDVVCEVCGRNFSSPKSLARHRKKMCHRSLKCTDCTKTFTKKNALLKHSFSHLGLLPYTCVRCRCHFRLAKLYRQHKCIPDRVHCVACLREFPSQEDFQQHKKDTGCWGNQEPKGDEIRCLECGQRFDTSEELKKHAGAHQRVLKCAECGKGFRSALLLMSHMGGHAGNSPCLCQRCGLGFPHQQNYDGHLKTCGQTPQHTSAPSKRQVSKSSPSETQTLSTKPDSTNPANPVTLPAAVLNSPTAPVIESPSPGPVTGSVSPDSGPSHGVWKLTLDKQPPPGATLVLFLPVCPSQNDGMTLPSFEVSLKPTVDLVTEITQDPECEAPLDLSQKSKPSESALSNIPLLPIKREPEEFEISGEANGTEGEEFKYSGSKAIIKANLGEKDKYADPLDLTTFSKTASGQKMDIKKEPLSHGSDFDLHSSTSCQLLDCRLEEEMKMEVDISHPACADTEK